MVCGSGSDYRIEHGADHAAIRQFMIKKECVESTIKKESVQSAINNGKFVQPAIKTKCVGPMIKKIYPACKQKW